MEHLEWLLSLVANTAIIIFEFIGVGIIIDVYKRQILDILIYVLAVPGDLLRRITLFRENLTQQANPLVVSLYTVVIPFIYRYCNCRKPGRAQRLPDFLAARIVKYHILSLIHI